MSLKKIEKPVMRKKSVEEKNPHLSFGKRVAFTIVMILFPLIILFVLEIILRVIHYGGDLDLVLTQKIGETTYCYLNKNVAKRFFSQQDIHIPNARTAVFKKEKSPETYRIFCLGGSTTAGFPYEYNATFPSLLKDRLDVLFPEKNIEVINVGISAINSYSVLDFSRELAKYDPDLFLIYMGHNEFYGALGIGSTQQIGKNRNLVLFYLKLQKVRLFNLLRDLIGSIGKRMREPAASQLRDQTLMAQAVKNKYISLNSEEYKIAQNYFERNLEAIIRIGQKSGAKIIASTLVSNLADQEPFDQQFSPGTIETKQAEWQFIFNSAYELDKSGDFEKALIQYEKAEKIDPAPAMLHFRQAKCLQQIGNTARAFEKYVAARDLDVLRFRASSDFNNIIREVGLKYQAPVIEMENVFAPFCQDSILDRNLFTDHLHPNFFGYFLMAKAFCSAMAENDCVVARDQWNWQRNKSDAEFQRLAGVTDLELEIANQRIRILTSHWPFKQEISLRKKSNSDYENLLEKTVIDLFAKKIGWNEAHYRIARYLEQQGDYENAAREYEAVIKVTPSNYYPYLELGDMLMRQREFLKAEEILKKGLAYSQQLPFGYAKLGMLYFFTQRPEMAVTQLNEAIEINQRANQFKTDEMAGAYYLLAMAYGQSGQLDLAKEAAQHALKIKPNYPEVEAVIEKLNAALKIK